MYLSMASYFDCEGVALRHFNLYFLQQSNKEREQVEKLMWMQNQCGALSAYATSAGLRKRTGRVA